MEANRRRLYATTSSELNQFSRALIHMGVGLRGGGQGSVHYFSVDSSGKRRND
jgi:hypothetical protein